MNDCGFSGLNKHLRKVHLGIRPFICDKCGLSCGDESELKLHLTRHIESKRYTCDHCQYSTFQKSSLKCKFFILSEERYNLISSHG